MPNKKGIKSSKGEREGPMLDFVYNVLRWAKVPVQSKNAIADKLYDMRKLLTRKRPITEQRQSPFRRKSSSTR